MERYSADVLGLISLSDVEVWGKKVFILYMYYVMRIYLNSSCGLSMLFSEQEASVFPSLLPSIRVDESVPGRFYVWPITD